MDAVCQGHILGVCQVERTASFAFSAMSFILCISAAGKKQSRNRYKYESFFHHESSFIVLFNTYNYVHQSVLFIPQLCFLTGCHHFIANESSTKTALNNRQIHISSAPQPAVKAIGTNVIRMISTGAIGRYAKA